MPVLWTLTALTGLGGLLIAGLYGLRTVATRWRQQPGAATELVRAAFTAGYAVASGPGWLSEEERVEDEWCRQTTKRDIDRLDMIEHAVLHRFRSEVEAAIRRFLPPEERGWYRVHTGEYALAGVA